MADEKSPVEDEVDLDQQVDKEKTEFTGGEAIEPPELDDDDASLETQVEELKETLLRSQADMQNLRRRSERDVENAHKYAIEKFVKDFLEVMDSMDKGLELAETTEGFDEAMLKGIQFTHKLLKDVSIKHGIEQINALSETFDPQVHQAMSIVESADHEPNTVMAVMQKGYTLKGRVIRAAMVVVTKTPTT